MEWNCISFLTTMARVHVTKRSCASGLRRDAGSSLCRGVGRPVGLSVPTDERLLSDGASAQLSSHSRAGWGQHSASHGQQKATARQCFGLYVVVHSDFVPSARSDHPGLAGTRLPHTLRAPAAPGGGGARSVWAAPPGVRVAAPRWRPLAPECGTRQGCVRSAVLAGVGVGLAAARGPGGAGIVCMRVCVLARVVLGGTWVHINGLHRTHAPPRRAGAYL